MKKFLPILYTLYFILYTLAPSARAQSTTLSVSPPVVEVLLAPTKKFTQTFTLQTTGENLEVTPEFHLAIPSDDQGHMTIDPSPLNPASLPLTFTISPPSTINHQPSTISVTLTLEAATTDTTQDIYLALVFRTAPSSPYSIPNTAYSIPGIAALLLITINPADSLPIELSLDDFSPPLVHDSWTSLTLTPTLKNTTGIMIRPQGQYEVIAPSGKTLFSTPLYPNLILGHSSRLLQGTEPCNLQGSVPCNPLPLTWSPTWHDLGPHRLRLTITTEGGTQLTQLEKVIWLLPIRIIVILTVLLALFIIFLVTRGKSLTPPLDRLSQKTYS